MGMFDTIYCRISLPGIGIVDDAFQSKDTPGQVLDTYEIRADGTLWRQAYDVVDRSDPKATGMKRVLGMCAQENLRWEREYLSGCLGFYGERPEGWVEFEADFQAGTLQGIREVSESDVRTRPRLAIDAITLDQARAEEREACSQIILNRAREAEEAGDLTLGLALLPLAKRVKRGGGAVPRLRKRLEELEALNAEAIAERDRLDKICREMIGGMEVAEAEWVVEKQALMEDRNHWFTLWKQASNEVLQRSPPTRLKKPGPLPKPNAGKGKGPSASELVLSDRDIMSDSMAVLEAGKTLTLDELWAKIDAGPYGDEVMTSEEMDEAKATRGMDKETFALLTLLGLSSQDVAAGRVSPLAEAVAAIRNTAGETPLQAEVERLQARVKQLVDEALAEAPMDPAQLRQAVIRQLAQDLDPSHEPDMDLIQAEVREVRRARAKRKMQ